MAPLETTRTGACGGNSRHGARARGLWGRLSNKLTATRDIGNAHRNGPEKTRATLEPVDVQGMTREDHTDRSRPAQPVRGSPPQGGNMGRSAAYDPTLDYVAIRRNVRRLANDQGRTLERLSVAADLGRHTARKVASGIVTPTPTTIAKLAHALGVTVEVLNTPCAEAEDETRGPCQLARVSALWCMTKCPNAYQVPDGCREYCKPMLGDFGDCRMLDCRGCPCLEGPSAETRALFAKWQQARGKR